MNEKDYLDALARLLLYRRGHTESYRKQLEPHEIDMDRVYRDRCYVVDAHLRLAEGWTPTPKNINQLPEPIRRFVHDLETRCNQAGDAAAISLRPHRRRNASD